MASTLCCGLIHLWIVIVVFRSTSADPHYELSEHPANFNQAVKRCSPAVLTTLATQQEVSRVLALISGTMLGQKQNNFTFWIGLQRKKQECVADSRPLKGFRWIQDGSEDSEVSRWAESPEYTCTSLHCAALKGEFNGTAVSEWGLIAVSCRTSYQFICKSSLKRAPDRGTAAGQGQETTIPEPELSTSEPPEPTTTEPEPAAPTTPEPEPEPEPAASTTQKPEPEPGLDHGTEHEQPAPPDPYHNNPDTRPEPQVPDPDPVTGAGSCERPTTAESSGIRSFIQNPDNSSRIQVECWPSVLVELHCSGRPSMWRLLDDSPANFSAVCLPCEPGFQKDSLGDCVDIDECGSGAPCRHSCLNTEGSFRCVCSDENGKHQDEDSDTCREMATEEGGGLLSGILFPVLVAVAAFLVLLLVIAVTVKCCLVRRSKKRAMKKAEKMAMKSKEENDSFQSTNEKAAT
ncbi:complement component C1q receptor-like [Xyrichtys novacula]|uniref:Complement component C1q receptor-like n=1 Tax=Xyrichtys novacula TaxID=13765 RepID=A0AAV1GQ33_XYRNO|nr:complement component C1q receptor-like [Xyrichtys novacula]